MKYAPLVFCFLSLASAQTLPRETDNQETYSKCPSYLDCATSLANSESTTLEPSLEAARKDYQHFDVCKAEIIAIQKRYNDWFLDPSNFKQIKSIYDQTTINIKQINQRLISLGTEEVEVLPEEGQTVKVLVTLDKIKTYLIHANDRLKNCPEDKIAATKRSQEIPVLNDLGIAHHQIATALSQMELSLNSSLKELNISFKLNLVELPRGYKLEVVATDIIDAKENITMDLLSETNSQLQFSEKEIWQKLGTKKIEGYSIDGISRYSEMELKYLDPDCFAGDFRCISFDTFAGVPYVTYASAKKTLWSKSTSPSTLIAQVTTNNACPPRVFERAYQEVYVKGDILVCDYMPAIAKGDCRAPAFITSDYCQIQGKADFSFNGTPIKQVIFSVPYAK